jgi:indolepyruvate ferredoxin oxidoreductase
LPTPAGCSSSWSYKDEYEVARLHLDELERARLAAEFGDDAKVHVLLHPPLLRSLGLKRKLRLGRSARPLFRLLHAARPLRGTPLDPFGYAHVRRIERELIAEYRELVGRALERLEPSTATIVAELAAVPNMVRGYEQIKLGGVRRMRVEAGELLARLERADTATPVELPVAVSG